MEYWLAIASLTSTEIKPLSRHSIHAYVKTLMRMLKPLLDYMPSILSPLFEGICGHSLFQKASIYFKDYWTASLCEPFWSIWPKACPIVRHIAAHSSSFIWSSSLGNLSIHLTVGTHRTKKKCWSISTNQIHEDTHSRILNNFKEMCWKDPFFSSWVNVVRLKARQIKYRSIHRSDVGFFDDYKVFYSWYLFGFQAILEAKSSE